MSPAGLRSLARSRRPAQNRPGAPAPAALERPGKPSIPRVELACVFPDFLLFGTPGSLSSQPPPFWGALIVSLIPETMTGEDPVLSDHRGKAVLPLLTTPGPGRALLATAVISGEEQGCGGLSPGSQARGLCCVSPAQWPAA